MARRIVAFRANPNRTVKALLRRIFRRIDRNFDVGALSPDGKNQHYCNWCTAGDPLRIKLKNGEERQYYECEAWHDYKKKILNELG